MRLRDSQPLRYYWLLQTFHSAFTADYQRVLRKNSAHNRPRHAVILADSSSPYKSTPDTEGWGLFLAYSAYYLGLSILPRHADPPIGESGTAQYGKGVLVSSHSHKNPRSTTHG